MLVKTMKLKRLIKIFGLSYMFTMMCVAIYSWFIAYYISDYIFAANINKYGEAWIEYAVHIIGIPSALYCLWNIITAWKNE